VAAQKAKLDAVLKTDLPALNQLLADRMLKALEVTTTEIEAAGGGTVTGAPAMVSQS
jgi:hypothetical protein